MRSIFDQYNVPENKLTHALACCLAEDRRLTVAFLRWISPQFVQVLGRLRIVEQQVPGRIAPEDEDVSEGLPDALVFSRDSDWALIIESKVAAKVSLGQLRRHLETARRAGFESIRMLLITTGPLRQRIPPRVIHKTWGDLYAWFGRRAATSQWAWRLVDYFRAVEARWIAEGYLVAGTLTHFDGFHFDDEHPYTAREGRRLIRLMRQDLVRRKDLRALINPAGPGRPAITGRGASSVWDFIRLKGGGRGEQFTDLPHLTLALHRDYIEVALTFPNGMRPVLRRRIIELGLENFTDVLGQVLKQLNPILKLAPAATPRVRINQRHFISQNSKSTTDAELDFDLRTAFPSRKTRVKLQPQWLRAVYDVIKHRRSNIQLQGWLKIPYSENITDHRGVLDLIAQTWLSFRPLIDALDLLS